MTKYEKFNRISRAIENQANKAVHIPALEKMVNEYEKGNLKLQLNNKLNKLKEKWIQK
tara:strand:+ start:1628 stop:1801 length:174 start_codon:yes stop_codon:yes gene_type:complete